MQINPPSPPSRAPVVSPLRRNDRDGPSSHRSLAWQAVFGRAAPFAAVDSLRDSQSAFAAATVIGDAAVRFDARPIVAPAAEAGDQALAGASGDQQEPVAATPTDIVERRGDAAGPALHAKALDAPPLRPSTTRPGPAAPATAMTPPSYPSGGAMPQGPARRPVDAAGVKPMIGRAAHLPRVSFMQATRAVTAHAVAVGEEIRIVVRGTALTAEDHTALVRIAADTLAGSPHAGRPIRVVGKRSSS